jgi:hypothetical protein
VDVEQLRRRPAPLPRSGGRVVAIVFVVLLAGAWLATQHHSVGSAVPPAVAPTVPSTTGPSHTERLSNGVRVEVWAMGSRAAAAAYQARMGAVAASNGPPACAHGQPDERAWSRPVTPTKVAGRYRCVLEQGQAAMWWTDDRGRLAHAVAPNGDLATLFNWWRAYDG